MKIAFVSSSGGHLSHLLWLRPWWERHQRFWVTFDLPDARDRLASEQWFGAYHPTNRNYPNLLRNTRLAWRLLRSNRPDVIVSTGAGVAIPFFGVARALGIPSVFIEVYDRIDRPSLTGRVVAPIASRVVAQWPEQLASYSNAVLLGPMR